MLIYEVNLEVDDEAKFSFAGWLPEHIKRMLEIDGFKAAYWFYRNADDEGREASGDTLWTIQYLIENRSKLDHYLNHEAEEMRKEAVDKFGEKFKASRRVLNLLSVAGMPFETEPTPASQ